MDGAAYPSYDSPEPMPATIAERLAAAEEHARMLAETLKSLGDRIDAAERQIETHQYQLGLVSPKARGL